MVRKILQTKDPRLRQVSKPVSRVDKKISGVIIDLTDTLASQKEPQGVGLAAPQIGKNLRVFVMNYQNLKRVVVNPEIIEVKNSPKPRQPRGKSPNADEIMEGCLSLPNYYAPIKRAPLVKLKYVNEKGEEVVEDFRGFFAQIVLHEIDHLNGITFIDRLLQQKKPLYKLAADKWEEVELL